MSRYDIAQANMVLGGIPYYMSYFAKGKSLAQNIDALFFSKGAKLRNEFSRLFASVFVKPEEMMKIVRFLSTRRSGYSREEIVEGTGLGNNGELSKRLDALATSDFIENYVPFGESKRNHRYKLIDPVGLFYLRFVDGQ